MKTKHLKTLFLYNTGPLITSDCSSGAQDLDSIRLSTYRTACKLRFVQKKCNSEYDAVKRFTALTTFCDEVFPLTSSPPPRTRLLSSAPGWHLECHRGFPRERHQHHGPQRWPLRGSPRNGAVHHLLPAEQAHAHHPPDQRGTVHKPAAQLPAGSLWPVSNMSLDRRRLVVCSHVSELLTCASAARSGVKMQTIYNRNVTTCFQRDRTREPSANHWNSSLPCAL